MNKSFIDEVKIYAKAGDGGNGVVRFKREKFRPDGGPDGGNGGNGGSVRVITNGNLNTLVDFCYKRKYIADNGKKGSGDNCTGKNGADIVLNVPIGTQILDEFGEIVLFDLDSDNQTCIIANGGKGGIGNAAFKTSRVKAPKISTNGELGDVSYFTLRLKLLSDVAIVGLPNAGKSSFLAASSNAKPKVAMYPFTTLAPILGFIEVRNFDGFVMADIPGLVEDASIGVGIGHRFLRHIERCKVIVHLIDISSDHIVEDYNVIRNELTAYSQNLDEKTEIVVLNKIDTVTREILLKKIELIEKTIMSKCYFISSITKDGISDLTNILYDIVKISG